MLDGVRSGLQNSRLHFSPLLLLLLRGPGALIKKRREGERERKKAKLLSSLSLPTSLFLLPNSLSLRRREFCQFCTSRRFSGSLNWEKQTFFLEEKKTVALSPLSFIELEPELLVIIEADKKRSFFWRGAAGEGGEGGSGKKRERDFTVA